MHYCLYLMTYLDDPSTSILALLKRMMLNWLPCSSSSTGHEVQSRTHLRGPSPGEAEGRSRSKDSLYCKLDMTDSSLFYRPEFFSSVRHLNFSLSVAR